MTQRSQTSFKPPVALIIAVLLLSTSYASALDITGAASNGDNPAYGCGKCHQKGGSVAFVKQF